MDIYAFRRINQQGNATGNTEAFVNVARQETVTVHAPNATSEGGANWALKGIKFYEVTTSDMLVNKTADMRALNSGQLSAFNDTFTGSYPANYSVTIATDGSTIAFTESDASGQCFEFLLWIQDQSNPQSGNDYVDPGLRNE